MIRHPLTFGRKVAQAPTLSPDDRVRAKLRRFAEVYGMGEIGIGRFSGSYPPRP